MTPKEAAIEVERILKEAGYMLGDLTFSEAVGARVAKYDFSAAPTVEARNIDGTVEAHSA